MSSEGTAAPAEAGAGTGPGVTVVIPTFNHAHYLEECLRSLLAQTHRSWQAIVVDDCSSDYRALEPVLARVADERIRCVRHDRNRGLAASRNTGIRASTTPYVFPLDADDKLAPRALELLVAALEGDATLDCAYGDVLMFGRANGVLVFPGPGPGRNVTSPRDTIPGAGTMMRKALWTRMGGYDEADALRHGREDFEFWMRAFNQGCRSKRVAEPLYLYRHSHTSMNMACRREDHTVSQYIHDKHRGVFASPEHARAFLSSGYLSAAEASYQKGEQLRSLRLAGAALRIDPGGAGLRQAAKALVPPETYRALMQGELRRLLPFAGYPLRGNARYRPFFVIGVARSGNTLLRRILTAHSALHIPPETFVLGDVLKIFRRHRRKLTWTELVGLALAQFEFHPEYHTIDVRLGPLANRLSQAPREQRNLAALVDAFYRYHAEQSGKAPRRWGDKTPLNSLYRRTLDGLAELFPDAQFVHIYRDPPDVIYSHLSGGFMRTIEEACERWMTVMRNVQGFSARHPAACHALRYEDLVGRPEATVRELCAFLEVEFEPGMLSSEKVARELGDVPAWFWHANVGQPIDPRHAGKGRTLFSGSQRATMEAIIGEEMAKLGYPPIDLGDAEDTGEVGGDRKRGA